MILIEHGPGTGTEPAPVAFARPRRILTTSRLDEVAGLLDDATAAQAAGAWVAGYLAYEAGYAFEPRLRALHRDRSEPLVWLGVFDAPEPAQPLLHRAAQDSGQVLLAPLRPAITQADHARAFDQVQEFLGAGDCYQVNLTFPVHTRLKTGTVLGLYGALRARQPVGYGAFLDLGGGAALVSRSPELFFRIRDGILESRPMKGTAPRGDTPAQDAALRDELARCPKVQAENLMIVDLLRNDIGRISEIGSVEVPELFAIESFATVHQMSSRIRGRLRAGLGLAQVMAALFPCGSVTGAPKIRAMQIIHAIEPHPRGAYCGAIGWAAPSGDQCWSVAIRTLQLDATGHARANVGGGVVRDSTARGEWEEALWKTRYAQPLTTPICA
ncbi:MAG: aminodeoxychorismate synthase component I [Roseinatronobacter sp.]